MSEETQKPVRVRWVSETEFDRLANTDVPGGEVYFEGDYLVIRHPDGRLEHYNFREPKPRPQR